MPSVLCSIHVSHHLIPTTWAPQLRSEQTITCYELLCLYYTYIVFRLERCSVVKIIHAFLEDHTHVVARSHLKFNSRGSASSSNLHTGWYLKALCYLGHLAHVEHSRGGQSPTFVS